MVEIAHRISIQTGFSSVRPKFRKESQNLPNLLFPGILLSCENSSITFNIVY